MRSFILILFLHVTGAMSDVPNSPLKEAQRQGFFDARLESGKLIKGNLYTIASIKVNKIKSLSLSWLNHYRGQPASRALADVILAELKEKLLGAGFVFAALEFELESAKTGHAVHLLIDVQTGSRFKLGGLVFSGSKTRQKTLERLSMLQIGETYDYRRVEKAVQKLARTGYFSGVQQKVLARDSLKNLVYPLIHLEDLKANNISGLLGFNNDTKGGESAVNGFVDIVLVNLLGSARDLNFHFSAQNREKMIKFEYKEPWLYGLPLGATFHLSHLIEDSLYLETSYGTTLFQDINFHSSYNLSFTRQFNETFFFQNSYNGTIDTSIFTSQTSEAFISGIELIQDWRNKVPSTIKGGLFKSKLNGIRRTALDTAAYLLQILTEVHLWFPLGKRFILKSKSAGAISIPLATSLQNRGNMFQLGGAATIRGYREKEFLTNAYVYNNFELQYLLTARNRVMLLLDPGLINKQVGDFYWNRVMGYGVGLDLGSKDWVFAIRGALSSERSIGETLLHVKIENRF